LGLLSEALQELQAAFECDAAIESLAGALMHLKMRLCEWEHFDRDRKHLADAIGRGERVTEPFVVLGIFDDPRLHREAARTSRANLVRSLDPRPWTRKIAADGRIKLGYFSADYSNHATTHLLHDLIESHNRERFEVCGFALGPHLDDPEGRRIRSTFDRVVDLHGMGDAEAVSLVRSMGIDIAIDLKGYTQDARPALFERRVAPIQVSFLGYPGTMASPKMDYLIADRVVIPATERAFYEEKIVYLPDSYQVNRATVETFDGEISRAGCKLPPEGTVFCCFNNTFKITPNVFSSWMRILAATPTSILWLLRDNDTAMKKLRARAASEGIEPTRLVFAERVPTNEHLARHRLADVFLDTTPYGAHTTASDALRMGVPVITLLGRSFPSRVAASLLDSIGAGDLAVNTQEDYERLAVSLASDRTALEAVRTRIRKGVVEGNLFRPAVFAVNLEQAFRKMAERQTAGHPPVDITING
jgi:predicted O-linked N-acetylglucosamine transferase (SPINDLY family)